MKIEIDKIKVGKRIRKEAKDILELAINIQEVGLIHPVSIDSENNLLCGLRRLEAGKLLGWSEIEAKVFPLDVEADENLFRQEFNPEEKVKGLERIETRERQRAKERDKATQFGGGGNVTTPVGKTRDIVAEKVGWSGRTYEKAKKVIESGQQNLIDMMNREGNVNKAYRHIKQIELQQERKIYIGEIKPIIRLGDFRQLIKEVADNSIDLLLTDPPYGKEYLGLWGDLAMEASRVLKNSAFLITYSGQTHLPEVLNVLSQHLSYYWLGMLYQKGVTLQVHHRNIWNRAKPILFFQKPPFNKQINWLEDVVVSEAPDKVFHKWGQNIEPLVYLLKHFTQEGDVVLDPFMGGGATVEACLQLRRNILAFDNDRESYDLIMRRLRDD